MGWMCASRRSTQCFPDPQLPWLGVEGVPGKASQGKGCSIHPTVCLAPHLCVRHPWLSAPSWSPAVSDGVPLLSFWALLALTLESAAAFSVASLCPFSKVKTSAGLGCPSQPFGGSLLSSGWSPSSLVPHLTPFMTCCVLYPRSSAWVTLFLQHAGFSLAFRRWSSVLPATTLSVCSLPVWLLFFLHKVAYSSSTQYVSEWLEGLLKHTWPAPPSAFLVP